MQAGAVNVSLDGFFAKGAEVQAPIKDDEDEEEDIDPETTALAS